MVAIAISHLVNREWWLELQVCQRGELREEGTALGVGTVVLVGLGEGEGHYGYRSLYHGN